MIDDCQQQRCDSGDTTSNKGSKLSLFDFVCACVCVYSFCPFCSFFRFLFVSGSSRTALCTRSAQHVMQGFSWQATTQQRAFPAPPDATRLTQVALVYESCVLVTRCYTCSVVMAFNTNMPDGLPVLCCAVWAQREIQLLSVRRRHVLECIWKLDGRVR